MLMSIKVMEDALKRLGELALEEARVVEMNIYGGSALAIAYDLREMTRDIDAVFENDKDFVRKAVEKISVEMNLSSDWLNDAVKGFISQNQKGNMIEFGSFPSEETPGLRIFVPSPEYFFAMKCMAMRLEGSQDVADIRKLAKVCGISDHNQALDVVQSFYADKFIHPKIVYALEDIFKSLNIEGSVISGRAGFKKALSAFNTLKSAVMDSSLKTPISKGPK